MRHQRVFLIRHGETEWSLNGRHTGLTDISLTENGRATARRLSPIVARLSLAQVFTSPLSRARQTCELAGSPDEIGARVDRDIARVRSIAGNVAVFAHGHVLRVFAARWIGLPATAGRHFLLDPAAVSVLSDYHGVPVVKRWNAPVSQPK